MKIFVVGTGRVAKCVIDKLTARGRHGNDRAEP